MSKSKIDFKRIAKVHTTWHQFSRWLTRTWGKDLYGPWEEIKIKKKTIRYRSFDSYALSRRIVGYEVMTRVERYCKKYLPEIKIVRCDDDVFAGSIILLIPHPGHGISVMYIPQCTEVQNGFFLYEDHLDNLLKELTKMKSIYKKKIKNIK